MTLLGRPVTLSTMKSCPKLCQPHRRPLPIDRVILVAAADGPVGVEFGGVFGDVGHDAGIEGDRPVRDAPFLAAPLEAVDIAGP